MKLILFIIINIIYSYCKAPVIGIDLGTTYSSVGIFREETNNVEIISNEQGNKITPSVVAFTNNEILIGEAAQNQILGNPQNTIFEIKRLIGRTFDDKEVQRDLKIFPFKVINVDNKPYVQVKYKGEIKTFSPEEISAMILSKMVKIAETYIGEKVTEAVITVPAYFNDAQRQATKDAGTIAGLNVLRIINEPTAASMAYGLNSIKREKKVLVFDLGGGTFDVSLLSIDNNVFEVIATNGDTHLGGTDFDQRLTSFFLALIKKKYNLDLKDDKNVFSKLRKEAERVKRVLSIQQQEKVYVPNISNGIDFTFTLTRKRFEEINLELFKSTLTPVKRVLKDAELEPEEVDEVVLVGGSTRIPKVRELLKEFFNGKDLNIDINPDEAISYGAAVQGGVLKQVKGTGNVVLVDATPLTLGIEVSGGVMAKLIERGTNIPCKKSKIFTTTTDNQKQVDIRVFEGERPMTENNHLLGHFMLEGIASAPRGIPQIEVTFEIDVNGILKVSAEDKKSKNKQEITITSDKGRLSKEEIERMVKAAELRKEEDEKIQRNIEAKSKLENYLEECKEMIKNLKESEKKEIEKQIRSIKSWLDRENIVDSDVADEKRELLHDMIEKAFKQKDEL